MKALNLVLSLLMLGVPAAYAAEDDDSTKTESIDTTLDIREFILLTSMGTVDLTYASGGRSDIEGAGGSVYSATGSMNLDANIDTTVTLSDAALVHTSDTTGVRNSVSGVIAFDDGSTTKAISEDGDTRHVLNFAFSATLAEQGSVQKAGDYTGVATVTAAATVSS